MVRFEAAAGGTEFPRSDADSDPRGARRWRSKLSSTGTLLLVTSRALLFMRTAGSFSSNARPVTLAGSFLGLPCDDGADGARASSAAGAITSPAAVDGGRARDAASLVGERG